MIWTKFIYILVTVFAFKSFSFGINTEDYLLVNNAQIPLLTINNADVSTSSSLATQSNSTSQLRYRIAVGKTLGVTGTVCWISGNILEFIGLANLINDGSGSELLVTGLALDLFGPTASCIGESIVMNSIRTSQVTINDNYFELKPKGWKFYGRSFLFLGIELITGIVAASSEITAFGVVAAVAGGTGNIFRGIAAIAPLVRVNNISVRISLQSRPIINKNGPVGLALHCSF